MAVPAALGGFAQRRQSTLRTRALALQHGMEPRIICGQLCAANVRVPKVDDPGCKAAVLAPQARTQQSDQPVGIFAAPAGVGGIEAIDPLQIAAPNPEVTRASPAPLPCP